MQNKFKSIILIVIFVSFISFPMVNDTFNFVSDINSTENRALKTRPKLNINLLDPYPAEYDSFYMDHFSLRSRIIQSYNNFVLKVYKKVPFPTYVVIGKNGWLFQEGDEMNCYDKTRHFNEQQMEVIKRKLELQQEYLNKLGCKFYFCITPNKASIYTENIPHTHYKYVAENIGEQLNKYLQKNSNINVISLYEAFLKHKTKHLLYYKLDSHWNKKGGFFAAEEICSQIGVDFPDIKPLPISDYRVDEIPKLGGDITNIIGNPGIYEDVDYVFTSIKTQMPVKFESMLSYADVFVKYGVSKNAKTKILLMADSYSNAIFPFLTESFSESLNVFDKWEYSLKDSLVRQEKPDVYLLLAHESLLWGFYEKK